MAKTKKAAPKRPRPRPPTQALIAVHDFRELFAHLPPPKKSPAQCLEDCLPPPCHSLLQQFGQLITNADLRGDRVVDTVWAGRFADLLVERFGYDRAETMAMISSAITAWNDANQTDEGYPTPFP